ELVPDDFQPAVPKSAWLHATDRYVDQLFAEVPSLGVPLLRAHFPRIYLDVNRAIDDLDPAGIAGGWDADLAPSAKARLGKGLIWTNVPPNAAPLYNAPLPRNNIKHRIERCYHPYHQALAALIDRAHARHGYTLHLDCHSMQSVSHRMHEEGAGMVRPDFILSDRDGTTCSPDMVNAARDYLTDRCYAVEVNTLFKGAEIVRRHGRPAEGRHSLQIEINRALYMDETTLAKTDGFAGLKTVLTGLVQRLTQWRLAP
ncbi:MAG: N-formylglutamate amidohydrolase, partial [Alphaproteobacteria bacterium]|nr:N-formylglutamate amidohydrolase [Alphaproteobacteria bacterium]